MASSHGQPVESPALEPMPLVAPEEEDDAAFADLPTLDSVMASEIPSLPSRDSLPIRLQARLNRNGRSSCHPHPDKAHSRRQSFLDSRKKRLQARSDYVERIRLSQSKAESTDPQRLLELQNSLLQAKNIRDALIAKTAASCAQEVARAKLVAKEMKRKRSEETANLRHEMEGRLAEAERRRLEIQKQRGSGRRHRGSSASVSADEGSDGKDKRPEAVRVVQEAKRREAATLIQRSFRMHRNAMVIKRFTDLNITIDLTKAMPFETVSMLFQDVKVRSSTARLLELCGLLDVEGSTGMGVEQSCRIFLSAFLILSHPAEVFSNGGKDETSLITQSRDLLCAFENWISSTARQNFFSGSFSLRRQLAACWKTFSASFNAWKEKDSKHMLKFIVAQFVELDAIWQTVKDDEHDHVTKDFKENIRKTQVEVFQAIRKLAGDGAPQLIKRAIAKSRRERTAQTPRGAYQREEEPKQKPAQPASPAAGSRSGSRSPLRQTLPLRPAPPREDEPKFVRPPMRQVLHDIMLDGDFRIQKLPRSPLEEMVAVQIKKAFFDLMKKEIDEGNTEKWVPAMAADVKKALLKTVPKGGSFYKLIEDAFNIPLIERECHNGTYDPHKFFTFVLWLLPKICSPVRDPEVKALEDTSLDFYARLKLLMDLLDNMELDFVNFLFMREVQPKVAEAIPTEKAMFADELNSGRRTLTRTREWLHAAAKELTDEANRRSPPDAPRENITPSPLAIYNNALLSLAISFEQLDSATIPETFHLDHPRLQNFREEARKIVVTTAIITTVKSLLRQETRTAWPELKSKITHLNEKHARAPDSTQYATDLCSFVLESNAIPPATQTHISSAVTRIRKALSNTGPLDPVVRVVFNRLKQFLRARLNAVSERERTRLATSDASALASLGMVEQGEEVTKLLKGLERLGEVNRKTYDHYYNSILRDFTQTAEREHAERQEREGSGSPSAMLE